MPRTGRSPEQNEDDSANMNSVHITSLAGQRNGFKAAAMTGSARTPRRWIGVARGYHHGALAEAMVGRALTSVRRSGAEQVSLRAVAQSLHVSPSAAYNHFSDKDALLVAVGDRGRAALDERMARVIAEHPGTSDADLRARLAGLGRAYVGFAVEEPHLFRLTFGPLCSGSHGGTDDASGPYGKLVDTMRELDRRGLVVGEDVDDLCISAWSVVHGVATLVIEGLLPPEAAETAVATFTRLVVGNAT